MLQCVSALRWFLFQFSYWSDTLQVALWLEALGGENILFCVHHLNCMVNNTYFCSDSEFHLLKYLKYKTPDCVYLWVSDLKTKTVCGEQHMQPSQSHSWTPMRDAAVDSSLSKHWPRSTAADIYQTHYMWIFHPSVLQYVSWSTFKTIKGKEGRKEAPNEEIQRENITERQKYEKEIHYRWN